MRKKYLYYFIRNERSIYSLSFDERNQRNKNPAQNVPYAERDLSFLLTSDYANGARGKKHIRTRAGTRINRSQAPQNDKENKNGYQHKGKKRKADERRIRAFRGGSGFSSKN